MHHREPPEMELPGPGSVLVRCSAAAAWDFNAATFFAGWLLDLNTGEKCQSELRRQTYR